MLAVYQYITISHLEPPLVALEMFYIDVDEQTSPFFCVPCPQSHVHYVPKMG